MRIEPFFPPVETVLETEPEELAVPLLKCLIQSTETGSGNLNLHNLISVFQKILPMKWLAI